MTSYIIGDLARKILGMLALQCDAPGLLIVERNGGAHYCNPAKSSGEELTPRVAAEVAVQRRPTPIAVAAPSIQSAAGPHEGHGTGGMAHAGDGAAPLPGGQAERVG